jgi:hypothetical protein
VRRDVPGKQRGPNRTPGMNRAAGGDLALAARGGCSGFTPGAGNTTLSEMQQTDRERGRGSPSSILSLPVPPHHPPRMLVVSETQAAAIRAAFDQGGDFSAAIELRRLFP